MWSWNEDARPGWKDSRRVVSSGEVSSSWMKDIAADATGAAKVVAERSMGSEMDGVR
jgi:hypothetical protein